MRSHSSFDVHLSTVKLVFCATALILQMNSLRLEQQLKHSATQTTVAVAGGIIKVLASASY